MSTIRVNTIQHSSANSGNMILHANGNVSMLTANSTLFVGNTAISNAGISISGSAMSAFGGMRNRLINGDMRIDQRYAGSANTLNVGASQFILDRWGLNNNSGTGIFTIRQMDSANTSASNYEASSAPAGFINSMKLTVTTANTTTSSTSYSGLYQGVEGLNIIDLDWGKSTAKPITVSFWVKSNITGQFSWAIFNQSSGRIYPSSVTINSTNTWEYKSFTVPGDTTGTWLVNNSTGLYFQLWPVLGSNYLTSSTGWNSSAGLYGLTGQTNFMATVGNTFYITGVQIEAGSTATPFEFRHYGQELALCQRYFQTTYDPGTALGTATRTGLVGGTTATYASAWYAISGSFNLPVPMRTTPTVTYWDGAGNLGKYSYVVNSTWTDNQATVGTAATFALTSRSAFFSGTTGSVAPWSIYVHYGASAEL